MLSTNHVDSLALQFSLGRRRMTQQERTPVGPGLCRTPMLQPRISSRPSTSVVICPQPTQRNVLVTFTAFNNSVALFENSRLRQLPHLSANQWTPSFLGLAQPILVAANWIGILPSVHGDSFGSSKTIHSGHQRHLRRQARASCFLTALSVESSSMKFHDAT